MSSESQGHRARRPRSRHQTRIRLESPWRAQRSHHETTLMQSSAADTNSIPSPVEFVKIEDIEWPFSKLGQEG